MKHLLNNSIAAFFVCISLFIATALQAQVPYISTYAGNGSGNGNGLGTFSGDGGPAVSAGLFEPAGLAVDDSGNLYICDASNNRIRKVNAATGIITTVAGDSIMGGFSGDGGPATAAQLFSPNAVALDDSGNIYIADAGNNCIRKVTAATGIITTIAGNGTGSGGFSGDGGPADSALLNSPQGVALDGAGNIYISDGANNRIRKITASTGIINTIAGVLDSIGVLNPTTELYDTVFVGGFRGDGGLADTAVMLLPGGLAVDASGNIYFADQGNNRIRVINQSTGIINTVAGNGSQGYSGDNVAATSTALYSPAAIALDKSGNLYIADAGNNRIREVNLTTGNTTTIAGRDSAAYTGDGGLADSATLYNPDGVAVDATGKVYIADAYNNVIRILTATPIATGINKISAATDVAIYPVPNNGQMTVSLPGNGFTSMKIYDELGRIIYTQTLDAGQYDETLHVNISEATNGIYLLQVMTAQGPVSRRIVKQ